MVQSVQMGNSGLRVSRLVLGTMNFGIPGRGHQGDWTLDLDQARPIFAGALERGVFTFDCADIYGLGASEEVVGALLKELAPRDEYVLQTKISMPMGKGANSGGLSRKHVREGIDASLRRLGHDYIDQLGRVTDHVQQTLTKLGFETERLEYNDASGVRKASVVGKRDDHAHVAGAHLVDELPRLAFGFLEPRGANVGGRHAGRDHAPHQRRGVGQLDLYGLSGGTHLSTRFL